MGNEVSLPSDVARYILSNPDLTPRDVLNACSTSKGSISFCQDPVTARSLLRRYYPTFPFTDTPWEQFRALATGKTTTYYAKLPQEDVWETFADTGVDEDAAEMLGVAPSITPNFPITVLTLQVPKVYREDILINAYMPGLPIIGSKWIAGSNVLGYILDFKIYNTREEAIQELFQIYITTIEHKLRQSYHDNDLYIVGNFDYTDFNIFKNEIDRKGFTAITPLPDADDRMNYNPENHNDRYKIIFSLHHVTILY